mgnify:CR=1 FL=1
MEQGTPALTSHRRVEKRQEWVHGVEPHFFSLSLSLRCTPSSSLLHLPISTSYYLWKTTSSPHCLAGLARSLDNHWCVLYFLTHILFNFLG